MKDIILSAIAPLATIILLGIFTYGFIKTGNGWFMFCISFVIFSGGFQIDNKKQ
jgi:hypothetical protein